MKLQRLCLALAALSLLHGCGPREPEPPPQPAPAPSSVTRSPLEDAQSRARSLDERRAAMQALPGTYAAGDATSRFVAYWDSGVLRLIDERSNFGDYGIGAARYYLDTTADLFLYEATDEVAVAQPAPEGARRTTRIVLAFGAGGRMLASEKSIDGKVQPVLDTEIAGVRAHLDVLRRAAGAARP